MPLTYQLSEDALPSLGEVWSGQQSIVEMVTREEPDALEKWQSGAGGSIRSARGSEQSAPPGGRHRVSVRP